MRLSALLIASSLAFASGAAAADPAQPDEPNTASSPYLDEVICRNVTPPTGTRLGGGRECHTRRDWDNRMKQAQRVLQQKQVRGKVGTDAGN